jgi:hypothetical protein
MVKKDVKAQWLVGDELKQDQFNFLYEVVKIVYDSALRDKLIAGDKAVKEEVVPQMLAFKSLMVIRNIQLRKAAEIKHAKLKAEREGKPLDAETKDALNMTEEELVAQRMENEKNNGGIQKSEAQLAAEEEDRQRAIYGRYWVWDGYFNDRNKETWLATVEMLKHINNHVLQDIEDYILLQGFKGEKVTQIEKIIDNDHRERVQNQKKLMGKDGEEFENHSKIEDKKRKFMNSIRPPNYWNFFEDGAPTLKVKHVLRYNADPRKAYCDGRIERILDNLFAIGRDLTHYADMSYKRLAVETYNIFEAEFKDFNNKVSNA